MTGRAEPPGALGAFAELKALAAAAIAFGRWRLAGLAALVLAVSVIEGLGLALLAPLTALVFAADAAPSGLAAASEPVFTALGLESRASRFAALGAAYGVLLTLRAAAISLKETRLAAFQFDFIRSVRLEVYAALAEAPWTTLAGLDRSEVLSALSEHLNRTQTGIAFLFRAGLAIVHLTVLLFVAFALSPIISALLLVIAGLVAMLAATGLGASRTLGQAAAAAARRLMFESGAFLSGLKAAKASGRERAFIDRFERTASRARAVAVDFVGQQVRLRRRIELTVAAGAGAVLLLGAAGGWAAPETLVAVAALFARAAPQFQQIAAGLQTAVNAAPAYAAARRIRDAVAASTPAPADPVPAPPRGVITFDNAAVAFEPEASPAVAIGSLSLPARGLVVVTGPSGAGKSTFAEVLAGLRPLSEEQMRVGRTPLSPAALAAWRRTLAFLPQEPFLFNASVRENIAWPDADLEADRAWAALARAGASGIVSALPQGLDHRVGEGGLRLSGGERQRLCLARLFNQEASLFILDEPTAQLDAASEAEILAELERLAEKALVVLISHSREIRAGAGRRIEIVDGELSWAGRRSQSTPKRTSCRSAASSPTTPTRSARDR